MRRRMQAQYARQKGFCDKSAKAAAAAIIASALSIPSAMNFTDINRTAILRVAALSLAGFIFNTTEFIPVALLSNIAASFAIPVEETGLMLTLYAWIVAVLSLPCMLLTAAMERRKLLMLLFAIFIASHVLAAIAWSYPILMLARAGIAAAHSVFWGITGALVLRIAPRSRKSQALGFFAMGVSLATVLGLPLGRVIGQSFGWRTAFAVIGIIALAAAAVLWKLLPPLPSKNAGSAKSLATLIRRPALLLTYLLTAVLITAHFTAYTYIEPFALHVAHLSASGTTLILFLFGISGILGSLLYNRFAPQYPTAYLPLCIAAIFTALLLLKTAAGVLPLWFALLFLWGLGLAGVVLALQIRVLQLAPDATDIATAIYSGIFNIGIGSGALFGSAIASHWGLTPLGLAAAPAAALALLLAFIIRWTLKCRN